MTSPIEVRSASNATNRTLLAGLAFIAALILFFVFSIQANNGFPIGRFTYAKVAFTDVGALLPGDDVRINSIRRGRVQEIKLVNNEALVSIRLDTHVDLYRDASAVLLSQSALGTKFVNLSPGTPQAGPLGDAIVDVTHTTAPTEISDLLDVFDPATNSALRTTLRETGGGSIGHGNDLQDALRAAPALLPNAANVSEALASPQADLPTLFASGKQLAGDLVGHERRITQLVTQFDATVRAITVDNAVPLAETLRSLPNTLDSADRTFRALNGPLDDSESALADLRSGAQSLGVATPDVRGTLVQSLQPLRKVPNFSDEADPAVVTIHLA